MEDLSGFISISDPAGIQRGLQGQDGTTTENGCYIEGGFNTCPAGADFTFNNVTKRLTASLACPLSAVGQSDFRQASQEGKCTCDASIQDVLETADSAVPLDCTCFVCPGQANEFGVAYYCTTPISGSCLSFNCAGDCNGDPDTNFINSDTKAPTAAPVAASPGDSAFSTHNPTIASTALIILCVARMFR